MDRSGVIDSPLALLDDDEIEDVRARTLGGYYDLHKGERWWRNEYEHLLARGYQLRPRYHPSWAPSWMNTKYNPGHCEDSFRLVIATVMDAMRTRDGMRVAIKRVDGAGRKQAEIGMMLTTPERLEDPTNHCTPVLDYFEASNGKSILIVMPLLRPYDDPDFVFVDEVLDFIRQTLEGLVFMHRVGVSHEDLSGGNIMMDATQLYPGGYHPLIRSLTGDFRHPAPYNCRRHVSVKYYFIDFGLSTEVLAGKPRLVHKFVAADKDAPEVGSRRLYDPFLLDVFTLGNVYKKSFFDRYANLDFLQPLIASMLMPKQSDRPTAEEALDRFMALCSKLNYFARRRLLLERDRQESFIEALIVDAIVIIREEFVRRIEAHAFLAGGLPLGLSLVFYFAVRGPAAVLRQTRMLLLAAISPH